MLVIIPCGSAKKTCRSQAGKMYLGGYHRACQAYARTLVPVTKILILSAKYGLLRLTDEIEPYELRMGQIGCVSPSFVRDQALKMRLLNQEVIALGGRDYTKICKAIWSDCETPLEGVGGIGKQLKWLKERTLCQS